MTAFALPSIVEGYGQVRPFDGVKPPPEVAGRAPTSFPASIDHDKLMSGIDEAFDACRISDGATLSFHHHLRNGDQVLNKVLEVASRRGLKGLRIAPNSLFPVHAPSLNTSDRG